MVWWFSKNKRLEALENKLNLLEKSLLVSFQNIKRDITETKNLSSYRLHETLRRLERLESEIFNLKDTKNHLLTHTISEQSQQDEAPVETQGDETGIAGKITEVQQNILILLAKLHVENPDNWIPAKQLGEELYPQKKYESIRPMISTYLDVLEEMNLARKLRKRRQVFVKLTNKGISYINPKLKIKIKPRLKQNKKSSK